MSAHTKGPWTINANEGEEDIIDGPDGMPIACFDMRYDYKLRPRAECLANGRLIAAAPRMFSVIEKGAAAGDAECLLIVEAVRGRG